MNRLSDHPVYIALLALSLVVNWAAVILSIVSKQ